MTHPSHARDRRYGSFLPAHTEETKRLSVLIAEEQCIKHDVTAVSTDAACVPKAPGIGDPFTGIINIAT